MSLDRARTAAFLLLIASGTAGSTACDEESGPVDCGDTTPTVELGAGAQGFLPLHEGGTVFVVCGPQGGRHVALRLRASGLDAEFGFAARLEETATARQIAFTSAPASRFEQDGALCVSRLFLVFVEVPTVEIDGVAGRLVVDATDSTGAMAHAERAVIVDGSMVTCGQ